MRLFIFLLLIMLIQSCVPVIIANSIKESNRVEQEAVEVLDKHNLILKFDQSANFQRESSIYSQDGKELIFIQKIVEYYRTGNTNRISDNDWRRRTYFHVVFLEPQVKIELHRHSVFSVVMTLEQNNIFEFDRINNNAIDYLGLKYGVTIHGN